jgi:ubiquinone/menaquinone biosynthesis C-methylase UbiE
MLTGKNFYARFFDLFFDPFYKTIKYKTAILTKEYSTSPVLDVCCITGGQTIALRHQKLLTTGLDINFNVLKYAKNRYGGSFICSDACRMPFYDGKFNTVVLRVCLHDKPQETRLEILREAIRVLADGGKIIIADIDVVWDFKSFLAYPFTFAMELFAGHYANYKSHINSGGINMLLKNAGLSQISRTNLPLYNSSIVVAVPVSNK